MPKAKNEKTKRGRTDKAGPKTGEAPLPNANGSARARIKTLAKKRVTDTADGVVRRAMGRVHATGEALFPAPPPKAELPTGYAEALGELKTRIRQARLRTVLAANAALIHLYWELGRTILTKQSRAGWGAKVVDRFAHDLRAEFPDMDGLSPRNLLFMRSFAEAYLMPKL